ncbi:50S ribosomal protein L6 [Sesbania bispinosa]|nr:50S ribosomal protein L6 [Sesbania bispinosa]
MALPLSMKPTGMTMKIAKKLWLKASSKRIVSKGVGKESALIPLTAPELLKDGTTRLSLMPKRSFLSLSNGLNQIQNSGECSANWKEVLELRK